MTHNDNELERLLEIFRDLGRNEARGQLLTALKYHQREIDVLKHSIEKRLQSTKALDEIRGLKDVLYPDSYSRIESILEKYEGKPVKHLYYNGYEWE